MRYRGLRKSRCFTIKRRILLQDQEPQLTSRFNQEPSKFRSLFDFRLFNNFFFFSKQSIIQVYGDSLLGFIFFSSNQILKYRRRNEKKSKVNVSNRAQRNRKIRIKIVSVYKNVNKKIRNKCHYRVLSCVPL